MFTFIMIGLMEINELRGIVNSWCLSNIGIITFIEE
jgi:hypothetical protein